MAGKISCPSQCSKDNEEPVPGALQMQAKVEDALSGAMVNCYGGGDGGMARRRWRR